MIPGETGVVTVITVASLVYYSGLDIDPSVVAYHTMTTCIHLHKVQRDIVLPFGASGSRRGILSRK
jgi:hypothetical protein